MSNEVVIRVENLSKRYIIGRKRSQHDGLRHVLEDVALAPWRWLRKAAGSNGANGNGISQSPISHLHSAPMEEFWALRDVNLEVNHGEVVGIIGRNGAGKSTLLKILSRITEPTRGRVRIKGRVASLLEVGTGFHPELTGRENIFLNGAILGMTRTEIKQKFDEIVAFAEIERFLDTPVKRYSSGMYVRLAFAVAAHLEPDILVVDEVLAVGDAQFQKKCLGKMQDVSRQQGRTVLFVSHNMPSILQLTSRAIVLYNGQLLFAGPTQQAVDRYAGTLGATSSVHYDVEHTARRWLGTQDARIISLRFDRPTSIFGFNEDFRFIAKVRAIADVRRIRFSMTIFTGEGTPVGSCFSVERSGIRCGEELEAELVLTEPRLAPGHYYCGVAAGKGDHRTGHVDFDVVLDTLYFEVRPDEGDAGTISSWNRGWGTQVFPNLLFSVPSTLCVH